MLKKISTDQLRLGIYVHQLCAPMVALARQLGLSEADTREAGMAGLVHDVGKALMPLDVLNKPGPLTREEFAIMKTHPEAGHRMLKEARGVGEGTMDVCLHHHEKLNGKGYPEGLEGAEISLLARMGAVCDVYDAITSNRPYKAGWDPAQSVQKMAQWSREGHFDDAIFQALVKGIGIYPNGSLVRLSSGRLGVIVDQSHSSLLTPVVTAIFVIDTREYCEPEVIDLSRPGCQERIVAREPPEQWGLSGLDDFWRTSSG
jgi:HD-GYP domain-containing protein (c-di-GMP phosphodiesterase class II)